MKLRKEILDQFIDPNSENRMAVEKTFQNVQNQLLDFLGNASNTATSPAFQTFDKHFFQIPENKKTESKIRENLQELYKFSMNPANPKYIGHMDSIPTVWSVLGDFIASSINNNLLSLEMSPFLTQLEYSLTEQFANMFGLPKKSGGILLSGGTLSNLQALIVARNTQLALKDGNLFSLPGEPVIFTSEHAHSSVQKIGMMMGIGTENIIKIKADENSKMDLNDLEFQIDRQNKLNKIPFAVVATAGTTVSGNIDPLHKIAEVCKKHNLWLHIDAIYGGAVIFSEKHKHLVSGIEKADSISFNPQKWMYVAKTCSMVLFRNFEKMKENFRISAPYMKEQDEFINLGEISIQGTKHAEVLKLWLSVMGLGKSGYEELVDHSFELSGKFISEIKKRNYLKIASEPQLNIICFRGEPENLNRAERNEWNKNLQDHLVKETQFFLSLPTYKDELWLRAVLLNPFLTERHIEELFKEIDSFTEIKNCR